MRRLVVCPKSQTRSWETPCQPGGFGQIGVGLVEADKHRFGAACDPFAKRRVAVKAIRDVAQRLCDEVTVLGAAEPYRDIGDMPFKAHRAQIGGQINIDAGMPQPKSG
ncbi:hypothetical protein D3C77_613060 [compost metagenome]